MLGSTTRQAEITALSSVVEPLKWKLKHTDLCCDWLIAPSVIQLCLQTGGWEVALV